MLLWYLGQATVVFELVDPGTGVIQARFSERSSIHPLNRDLDLALSTPTSSARVWFEIDRWAHRAATQLRRGLDER